MLPGQQPQRLLDDAREHWLNCSDVQWKADSHWQSGLGDDAFDAVGRHHLALFDTFAEALGLPKCPETVIEWGCGGGANAVSFAQRCQRFIAADISPESVDECVFQVALACDAKTEGVVVDVNRPEAASDPFLGACDLFLCLHVMGMTARPIEALRIVRIAERTLKPGGMAMIQINYHTTDKATRGRRRDYRRDPATMTTFAVDDFWRLCAERGLTPRLVELEGRNGVNERSAYFALTKPR